MTPPKTRLLKELAEINPRATHSVVDDLVSFVGMADLDEVAARTSPGTPRRFSEVAKGYTPFQNGDLLAAKITPCWQNGKVGEAALELQHGMGSTEFHVIRPGPEADRRYLLHYLRTPRVRDTGTLRMTGSGGQRRVPTKYISDLTVPIPPLAEQRRIASILDEADAIRTKRRVQLAHLDELPRSLFNEVADCQLQTVSLSEVATFTGGGTLPSGEQFSDQADGTLLLKVSDMNHPENDIFMRRAANWTRGKTLRSATLNSGAVVFPKRGAAIATNKKRITTRRSALDPNLMGVSPNPNILLTDYLYFWLQSLDLLNISSGSTVPQLNKKDLSPLSMSLPPLRIQQAFTDKVTAIRAERERVAKALDADEELFAALQHRAFHGEL